MTREKVPARGVALAVLGILAIGQRAFVTLWRQPVLVVSTMVFPVVYLLILGNAMNRQLELVPLAVVDEAGNAYSAECRRGVLALETGRRLVAATFVADRAAALEGLRRGKFRGVWVLPFGLAPSGPRAVLHRRQHGSLLVRDARVGAAAGLAGGRGAEGRGAGRTRPCASRPTRTSTT